MISLEQQNISITLLSGYFFFFGIWFIKHLLLIVYETRKSLLLSVFYPLIQCIITADELVYHVKTIFFSIKSNARFFLIINLRQFYWEIWSF